MLRIAAERHKASSSLALTAQTGDALQRMILARKVVP